MADINRNLSGLITPDQIVILDTTNASATNGSLYVEGGASLHDIYSNGHVMINDVDVTPNLNDIVFERESVLSNNVSVWTNIPNFEFDSSISRSFTSYIYINVSTGVPKYAYREINGVFKSPGGWVISTYFSGDVTGVTFQISTESGIGKIQYKNSNSSGTTTIRYRATTNAPPGSSPLGVASGIIENLTGPFTANKFIYANTNKTLASTDIEYNANQLVVGGTSRLLLENANSFQDFSAGGSLTSMGDASIAQKLIVGERIGIANTSPSYQLDVIGDINFSGDLYQNGNIFSGGGGGGAPSQWLSGTGGNLSYTKGNVGIGTTAPQYKIDINGNLRATTGITTASIFSNEGTLTNVISTNITTTTLNVTNSTITNLVASTYTGGSMSLSGDLAVAGTLTTVNITTTNINTTATNITAASIYISNGITSIFNSNTLGPIVTTGGNVGIGTTSPSQVLDILTNSNDELGMGLRNSNTGGNSRINFNMYVGHSTSGNAGQIYASTSDPTFTIRSYSANTSGIALLTGGAAPIKFSTQSTERMRVTTSGNIGIGTTSPQYTLDVNPSNVYSAMRINGGSILSNTNGTVINMSPNDGAFGAIEAYTTGNFNVKIPLCLSPWGGNVGVGLTSPQSKLDVNGSLHANGVYSNFLNSTTGYLQIAQGWESNSGYIEFLQANGTRKGYIGYGGDTVAFQLIGEGSRNIELATNNVIQMTIASSGNVGIGTTIPTYAKLNVVGYSSPYLGGGVYFSPGTGTTVFGAGNQNVGIYANAYMWSGFGFLASSDQRIKTNIMDVNDSSALNIFRQLKPKTYNYIDIATNTSNTVYGFIAQEVKSLINNSVSEKQEYIPNIYDMVDISIHNDGKTLLTCKNKNIITFDTTENTTMKIKLYDAQDKIINVTLDQIVSDNSFTINENLTEEVLFAYGQEVKDFNVLNKDAIWTIATAALQEVDRQHQATQQQLAETKQRLDALEAFIQSKFPGEI